MSADLNLDLHSVKNNIVYYFKIVFFLYVYIFVYLSLENKLSIYTIRVLLIAQLIKEVNVKSEAGDVCVRVHVSVHVFCAS